MPTQRSLKQRPLIARSKQRLLIARSKQRLLIARSNHAHSSLAQNNAYSSLAQNNAYSSLAQNNAYSSLAQTTVTPTKQISVRGSIEPHDFRSDRGTGSPEPAKSVAGRRCRRAAMGIPVWC